MDWRFVSQPLTALAIVAIALFALQYRAAGPIDSAAPSWRERLRFWWLALIPWLAAYKFTTAWGVPPQSWNPGLGIEGQWPIVPWTGLFYWTAYPAAMLLPFLVRTRKGLHELTWRTWMATLAVFAFYLTIPSWAPRRPFEDHGALSFLLHLERNQLPATAAFPSFHVIWGVLVAQTAQDGRRGPAWLWWLWAFAMAISCLTTGMHYALDVVAGWIAGWIFIHYRAALDSLAFAERPRIVVWSLLSTAALGRLIVLGVPSAMLALVSVFVFAVAYFIARRADLNAQRTLAVVS